MAARGIGSLRFLRSLFHSEGIKNGDEIKVE